MKSIASITIDLDPLYCYSQIYGAGETAMQENDPVYDVAVSRFVEMLDSFGVTGSLFVVGSQLAVANKKTKALFSNAVSSGYEVANHTWSHRYDFSLLETNELQNEISKSQNIISDITGVSPVGLRAPGYNVGRNVISALKELGYKYDSSVFPSQPYYMARASVIALLKMKGKHSQSIPGNPRVMLAPNRPYYPSVNNPFKKAADDDFSGILELPVTVSPIFRTPLLGSLIILQGKHVNRLLFHSHRTLPFLNIEFHGVDFLGKDEIGDGMPSQPDLNKTWAYKKGVIESFIEQLHKYYRIITLEEVANAK